MPKLTLLIDIGTDKQKFDFPAEFVDAATQFIATQTDGGNPPVGKYPDVHSLIVSHVESLADVLVRQFPQKIVATQKAIRDTADATIAAELVKQKKATKV